MTSESVIRKNRIKPLAFGMYFWVVVALAAAGLVDSIYLSVSHYRNYVDIGYSSFCAISRAINCDTVSQSPYAIFLGMPVPVWGVIGYIFLLLLIYFAGMKTACKRRIWALLILVSALYSIYSIILAVISHFYIHSYCIMCILSYGINFMLLFYCWLIRRRFDPDRYLLSLISDFKFLWHHRRMSALTLAPLLAGVVLLWTLFPTYWRRSTVRDIGGVRNGFDAGGLPLDRIRKCGPRHYRVYRLHVLSVQQNAFLSAQIDEPVPRKNKNYSSPFPNGFTLQSHRQNSISRGFRNVVTLGHLCRG